MAWFDLLVAGLLEIGWALGLKHTQGFSRLWPSVATLAAMVASFGFLGATLKHILLGTGSIGLIVAGVVGLRAPQRDRHLMHGDGGGPQCGGGEAG